MATSRGRRPNPARVKIHRSYTVDEVARVLDVHKNTVRHWLRQGLDAIDERRPSLIHGRVLRGFLSARREKHKKPCPPGQLYCVRCRVPKAPASGMVDYVPMTSTSGNLRGICPDCESLIHRRVSLARLGEVKGDLDVALPQAHPRIGGETDPSVDCHFGSDGEMDYDAQP